MGSDSSVLLLLLLTPAGEAYKQQMIELSQKEKFDLNGFYDHLKVPNNCRRRRS